MVNVDLLVDRLSSELGVPWSWAFGELLKLLRKYPGGVTTAIIGTELQLAWDGSAEALAQRASKARGGGSGDTLLGRKTYPLSGIVKGRLRLSDILEAPISSIDLLQEGSPTRLFTLSQEDHFNNPQLKPSPSSGSSSSSKATQKSSRTVRLPCFMHKKFFPVLSQSAQKSGLLPLFTPGRTLRVTHAQIFHSKVGARLLPTEYVVPVLDGNTPTDRNFILSLKTPSFDVEEVIANIKRLWLQETQPSDDSASAVDPMSLLQVLCLTVARVGAARKTPEDDRVHQTQRRVTLRSGPELPHAERSAIRSGNVSLQSQISSHVNQSVSTSQLTQQAMARDTIDLMLWDEQVDFGNLFKKNDVLLLFSPGLNFRPAPQDGNQSGDSSPEFFLEYGNETIVSVLPTKAPPRGSAPHSSVMGTHLSPTLSPARSRVPPLGRLRSPGSPGLTQMGPRISPDLDFEHSRERVLLSSLKPNMANVSVFGKVEKIWSPEVCDDRSGPTSMSIDSGCGTPLTQSKASAHEVRALLSDQSGKLEVAFYGAAIPQIVRCARGNLVFIRGVSTIKRSQSSSQDSTRSTQAGANQHLEATCGFFRNQIDPTVTNVSMVPALMTSPSLAEPIVLCARDDDPFLSRCTVAQVKVLPESPEEAKSTGSTSETSSARVLRYCKNPLLTWCHRFCDRPLLQPRAGQGSSQTTTAKCSFCNCDVTLPPSLEKSKTHQSSTSAHLCQKSQSSSSSSSSGGEPPKKRARLSENTDPNSQRDSSEESGDVCLEFSEDRLQLWFDDGTDSMPALASSHCLRMMLNTSAVDFACLSPSDADELLQVLVGQQFLMLFSSWKDDNGLARLRADQGLP